MDENKLEKQKKWRRRLKIAMIVVGVWLVIGVGLTLIFGPLRRELEFELFPPNVKIGSLDISQSILVSWVLMVMIIAAALVVRIFFIPRFQKTPDRPIQNVLETMVEGISNYTEKMSDVHSKGLSAYIFGLAIFMVFCMLTDFFGVRSPLTDLRLAGTLAVATFLILNYYGLKRKGIKGRLKSLASPAPAIMPIRILSDLAAPVSLACRLFGNMVGGMIVIELLYVALGNFAFGIPAVLGLYFSIFEPIIQIYIFITLTLNYIREAVE